MMEAEGSSLDFNQVKPLTTQAYLEQFGDYPYGLDDSREHPPLGMDGPPAPIFVDAPPEPETAPDTVEEFLAQCEYQERLLEQRRKYRIENVLHQAAEWIMERDEIDYETARLYVEERLDA